MGVHSTQEVRISHTTQLRHTPFPHIYSNATTFKHPHTPSQIFRIDDGIYERTDKTVTNPRGQTLQCSHFEPTPSQRKADALPCVIYLHGNCGSRQDALDYVPVLLPLGITLFALDFSGSGQSDGEYVSLGFFEKQDLAAIVDHLHQTKRVSKIGLWGRSMGAVTSIMYASKDPTVGGIVCDSPYSELSELMIELALGYKSWVPKWLLKMAIGNMRDSILERVGFDIYDLNTVKYAAQSDVPALIVHADEDLMVPQEHSKKIQEAYAGECFFMRVEGGHNDDRPNFFLDAAANFFVHHLISKPAPANRGSTSILPVNVLSRKYNDSDNIESTTHADPMSKIGGGELTSDEEGEESPKEAEANLQRPVERSSSDDLFADSLQGTAGHSGIDHGADEEMVGPAHTYDDIAPPESASKEDTMMVQVGGLGDAPPETEEKEKKKEKDEVKQDLPAQVDPATTLPAAVDNVSSALPPIEESYQS